MPILLKMFSSLTDNNRLEVTKLQIIVFKLNHLTENEPKGQGES